MAIKKEQLIAELNKDIEWEFAASVQYVQHAAMMTGPEFDSIIKELRLHVTEEMQHATTLAQQVAFLGGIPTVKVEKVETSRDTVKMLEQDLKAETMAIARYKERIAQAETLGEYGLRRILEDILTQEEEHKRDLMTALRQ